MAISPGRMIRKDISKSEKFASLSKESMVLFSMLIPHYNAHGKINGSPHYIKGEVCPLVDWLTVPIIERCLREISLKTSVKWFAVGKLCFLQSMNNIEHQELRPDRLGEDRLPSYQDHSGSTPGIRQKQDKGEVEVKEEEEVQGHSKVAASQLSPFDLFWKAYPKKVKKGEALKAWEKIKTDKDVLLAQIMPSLELQKRSRDWTQDGGQFIPHPSNWLNQRRWLDEPQGLCFGESSKSLQDLVEEDRIERDKHV